MSFNTHRERDKYLSEINVTPLVDVFLVLLIIFMVAAPLLQQGLDVDLPSASAAAITRSETDVVLTIGKNGQYYFQDRKTAYSLEELEKKLGDVFGRRDKKEIYLKADAQVPYGTVVSAISLFKKLGLSKVGMITKEPSVREET